MWPRLHTKPTEGAAQKSPPEGHDSVMGKDQWLCLDSLAPREGMSEEAHACAPPASQSPGYALCFLQPSRDEYFHFHPAVRHLDGKTSLNDIPMSPMDTAMEVKG